MRNCRLLFSAPLIRLDDRKAGFDRVDKKRVEKIINDASKGSLFYQNEQRLAQIRLARVRDVEAKCNEFDALSQADKHVLRAKARTVVADLEAKRTIGVFGHLDMDCFYAAVAQKKDPSLRSKPFAVGNLSMLSTTNYVARGFGVRAGIPGYIAKRLCPQLVFAPVDFPSYEHEAQIFRDVVAQYDKDYFSVGLDEMTFDLQPFIEQNFPEDAISHDRMLQRAEIVLAEMRKKILDVTQLSASGGIAPTTALSKVAGNINKPDGQFMLRASTAEGIKAFLATLPMRKFPGIGRVLEEISTGPLRLQHCGDVLREPERVLYALPAHTATFLLGVGLGTANAAMPDARPHPKSISHSRTLPAVISQPAALSSLARRFMQICCESMQEQRLVGRVVGLSIKTHKYQLISTSKHADVYSNDPEVLCPLVLQLLEQHLDACATVRLLGVRVSDIVQLPSDGDAAGTDCD